MRDLGPRCKHCKRFRMKLCSRPAGKCAWERLAGKPRSVIRQPSGRASEYALQLQEKQKAKTIYGLMERQFRNYYRAAVRKQGATGDVLMSLLESRLDNVVYRLGFTVSRPQARQAVLHGHFRVNSQKVNIPSYSIGPGDVIEWTPKALKGNLYKYACENVGGANIPSWLTRDGELKSGQVITAPEGVADVQLSLRLIVEYYSRR